MRTIKAFIKTYSGSMIIGQTYLAMISNSFDSNDVYMIMILLFFINLLGCVVYFMCILWPFYFLLSPKLASLNLKQAVHKFLAYFSVVPAFLCTLFIILFIDNKESAMQFSMLLLDVTTIIYLGFIFSLKNKIIS